MLKSIRARLSLSFGWIALLVAISVGIILQLTLRGYYARMEQDYLSNNARAIGQMAGSLVNPNTPAGIRSDQLYNYAFLSQTRIRLLDPSKKVIADTGPWRPNRVALGVMNAAPGEGPGMMTGPVSTLAGPEKAGPKVFIYVEQGSGGAQGWVGTKSVLAGPAAGPEDVVFFSSMPAQASVYGFRLAEGPASSIRRSALAVITPIQTETGILLGYVELSEGPAYGQEILNSVLRGWIVSSALAVLLAFGVGLWISRRISAPVQALTEAAGRMYAGDLSARVAYQGTDELGQLAGAFNEMSGRLEETIQALRRFVVDAAHELQTPLTALRTNLELAADGGAARAADGYIRQAQVQVERLSCLTSSLLALSRMEAGGTQAEAGADAVDLEALLRQVVEPYAAQAEQAGQALELDICAAPPPVSGNPERLRSAVSNLLDNALKFTPAGGRICVSLKLCRKTLCLAVADNGIGIPPDEVDVLFNRFHRGRNASAYPGSGLGLAIVRAVAQAHGGSVKAENGPTGGAVFRLCLPAAQGGAAESTQEG